MDEMTQQNAALVEQAAAAAQSMRDQADTLSHAVSVFKLDHHATQLAAPTARLPVKAPAVKKAGMQMAAPGKTSSGSSASDEWEEF